MKKILRIIMKIKLETLLILLICGVMNINVYAAGSTDTTKETTNTEVCEHIFRTVPQERASAATKKNGTLVDECTKCGYKTNQTVIFAPVEYTLSKTTYKYSKKACRPIVTVKDKNGRTISKANYTVTYKNNVKPGTAYAIVKFKGNHKGQAKIKFSITPYAPTSVKATTVNISTGVSLSWKKAVGAVSYKVYRSVKGGKWTCLGTTKSTKYKDKTATKTNTCYKYYVISVASGGAKSVKSKVAYTNKYTAAKQVYTKIYNDIEYEVNQKKKTVTAVKALGDYKYSSKYGKMVLKNHKGTLTIKSYVDGYPVTVIGRTVDRKNWVYDGIQDTLYTKIVIPDTVLKINDVAFSDNDVLQTVVLSNNLKYVGYMAFDGCDNVSGTIELPDSLYCHATFDKKAIGDNAYTKGSTKLEHLEGLFNDNVTIILPETYTAIDQESGIHGMNKNEKTIFISPLKADEIYIVTPTSYNGLGELVEGEFKRFDKNLKAAKCWLDSEHTKYTGANMEAFDNFIFADRDKYDKVYKVNSKK